MTRVLITVDTELSPALHAQGISPEENYRRVVLGEVEGETCGIGHQIERLNAHGLKAVFFVEALSASALGLDHTKRIVDRVLSGGHEVQLHLHPEWLRWIERDPVNGRRGDNLWEFAEGDQRALLEIGIDTLVRAGAPKPIAFRAGNYGADNRTLRTLASLSLRYDTSYNQPYLGGDCRIEAPAMLSSPAMLEGVIEIPITFFEDLPNHTRPLQVCAVSSAELGWCLADAVAAGRPTVVIVSHGFELLNARRTRANKLLLRRFERLCERLGELRDRAPTGGFGALDERELIAQPSAAIAKSNPIRTFGRMVEQAAGTILYDRT